MSACSDTHDTGETDQIGIVRDERVMTCDAVCSTVTE
jgi:hypothetical protein